MFIAHVIDSDDNVTLYGPFDTNEQAMAFGASLYEDDGDIKSHGSDKLNAPVL